MGLHWKLGLLALSCLLLNGCSGLGTSTSSQSQGQDQSGNPSPAPTPNPTPSPTSTPSSGQTYYLSPTGKDGNDGLSASSPWLTPRHSLNCGDTIIAAASTAYSGSNLSSWGTVTCPAGNSVAWLKCESFDACKVVQNGGITVNASYWGVQGFEVDNSNSACFGAVPASSKTTVHHIIFANNIANGCQDGGIGSDLFEGATGPAGVDYLVMIGNLIFNAAQGSSECFSGISIYEPVNSDTAAGTHMYLAQNISWGNVEPASCAGGSPTDGEGIILDTWNNNQTNGQPVYSGQGVVENNLLLGNGSLGFEVFANNSAIIIAKNNTTYGNGTQLHSGEIILNSADDVTVEYNISQSAAYDAVTVYAVNATDSVNFNWLDASSGKAAVNNGGGTGFTFGANNTLSTSPGFANPVVPGAPNCSGTANTLSCMAATIAGFKPSVSGASTYGYQPVTSTYSANTGFPAWLCNANLPSGVISNYCK